MLYFDAFLDETAPHIVGVDVSTTLKRRNSAKGTGEQCSHLREERKGRRMTEEAQEANGRHHGKGDIMHYATKTKSPL